MRVFDSPGASVCRWILKLGIGPQRAGFVDFCFTIGSGERGGESSVSAERKKIVLVIMDFKVGYYDLGG